MHIWGHLRIWVLVRCSYQRVKAILWPVMSINQVRVEDVKCSVGGMVNPITSNGRITLRWPGCECQVGHNMDCYVLFPSRRNSGRGSPFHFYWKKKNKKTESLSINWSKNNQIVVQEEPGEGKWSLLWLSNCVDLCDYSWCTWLCTILPLHLSSGVRWKHSLSWLVNLPREQKEVLLQLGKNSSYLVNCLHCPWSMWVLHSFSFPRRSPCHCDLLTTREGWILTLHFGESLLSIQFLWLHSNP